VQDTQAKVRQSLVQPFKCWIGLKTVRKSLFVETEAGTYEMVGAREAEDLHFSERFVSAPAFGGHTICGDHHASAIVSKSAMDEYLLMRILFYQLQESYEGLIMRERTMPRKGDVMHAKALDYFAFALSSFAAGVDHDIDSHFRECVEASGRRLTSTKERGSDLTEVSNAFDFPLMAEIAWCRARSSSRGVACQYGATNCDRQQETRDC
jgi:hypothetical protein